MATGELRERVRERLVSRRAGARRRRRRGDRDEVVRLLADAPPERGRAAPRPARARARRLRRGDDRHDARLLPGGARRPRHRRRRRARLRVRRGRRATSSRRSSTTSTCGASTAARRRRSRARRRAGSRRLAVENPAAPIEPAGRRRRCPAMRRAARRGRRATSSSGASGAPALMTYDDLLTRLHATLTGPGGAAVAARLRERYKVVLVDEFQDTDPVQWDIMRRAFGAGTLVLIGDPKQAIYAFRGADVYAYLAAARAAATHATLQVNWRSDQGLIDAYDALFGGAKLGHEGIVYREVRGGRRQPRAAADRRAGARAAARAGRAPRRAVDRAHARAATRASASAREHVAQGPRRRPRRRCSSSGAEIERRADDGTMLAREPVRPGPRRGARPHAPQRGADPRRARRGRHPRRDQRRGQRVRHAPGARLAAAARGDRAADVDDPRARAAALTPFLGWSAGARRVRGRGRRGRRSTAGCTTGRGCCASAASRR